MLSLKLVLCFYLIQSLVYGQLSTKYYSGDDVTTSEFTPTDKVSDEQCPQDKSLHSKNDIRVMIDYVYKQLSIDEQLSEAYKSQAELVRDNYIKDLKQFIEWFQNQPEHLKHVLDGLGQVREQHIEPIVKNIANALKTIPELEDQFNDKYSKLRKVLLRQKRYEAMCSFNCGGMAEHYIFKRAVQNDYYCSSIEELYDKITKKIHEAMEQLKNKTINQLSTDDKNYKESVDKIKNNLKDKALQEFGRTMYDILILQDEYHHFVEDLNITTIEMEILSIQELSIKLDEKLLQLHIAVEKYGQHCKSCGEVLLVRNTRRTNAHLEGIIEVLPENVIDSLIDSKFDETVINIKNDWNTIFNNLNELIHKVEQEDSNLGHFKPIQEEVVKMTNEERQILEKMKNIVPQSKIKNVLDLVKKSQDLLKLIDENIAYIESLLKQ